MHATTRTGEAVKHECPGWDEWIGTPAALVEAGIVREDQIPGEPGRPKVMMTFHRGQRVTAGVCVERDETYVSIQRLSGRRLRVVVGLRADERARRDVAREIDEGCWRDFREPGVQQRLAWLRARGDAGFQRALRLIEEGAGPA